MTGSVSISRGARLTYSDDEAVTQGSNLPNGSLFVVKRRARGKAFGRIRAAVVGPASATPVLLQVRDVAAFDDAVYRPPRQIDQPASLAVCVPGELVAACHPSPRTARAGQSGRANP